MKASLVTVTPNAEETIVYIARVSSSRKDKKNAPEVLINYLVKHKHWSPFEHAFMTLEIETSKAIGIQLLRHRSFTFQEFSQRYQDVSLVDSDSAMEPIDLRLQCENNRQSSLSKFDPMILCDNSSEVRASDLVSQHLNASMKVYKDLLEAGVSRETARMVLPLTTKTKIYMTGSVRSWIHFLAIRNDSHAQLEMVQLAKEIQKIFTRNFPIIQSALAK